MPGSIRGCVLAAITEELAGGARARAPRRIPVGLALALAWLLGMVALAALAPQIGLQNPDEGDLLAPLALPSAEHWLGTDSLGRDTFARLIYGARVSLAVAIGSVTIGLSIGGALGLFAGYFGTRASRRCMTISPSATQTKTSCSLW